MNHKPTRHERTQYWQAQVEAWQQPGQDQIAFCREHEVNYSRFVYWLGKFRGPDKAVPQPASKFIPVVNSTPPTAGAGLVIRLPDGVGLRGVGTHNIGLAKQLLGNGHVA